MCLNRRMDNMLIKRQNTINQLNSVREQILPHWNQLAGIIALSRNVPKGTKEIKALQDELQKTKKQSEFVAKELEERKAASEEDAIKIEELKSRLENELSSFEDRYSTILSSGELLAQEEIFKNSAVEHGRLAKRWLIGVVVAAIVLLIVIFVTFKNFCFELDCFTGTAIESHKGVLDDAGLQILWYELTKAIIFRVFIISIAVYLLMFTIKNYECSYA